MLTGISGSNTVEIALMISGFNAAVFSASATSAAVRPVGAGSFRLRRLDDGKVLHSVDVASLPVERRLQRVPGEAGAFYAHRELAHAREHRELAHVLDRLIRGRGHHPVEALEQRPRLGHRLALDRIGHQRGRRLRDRAAGSLERDVRDAVCRPPASSGSACRRRADCSPRRDGSPARSSGSSSAACCGRGSLPGRGR